MVRVLALVIGAVIAFGVLWGVGEFHYRNCVDAAQEQPVEAG